MSKEFLLIRDLSLLQNVQTRSGAHPSSYSLGTVVLSFPGVKRDLGEIYHQPSSSVEIKNEWRYTSTHPDAFMAKTEIILPLLLIYVKHI
jgi:hypothetical protein